MSPPATPIDLFEELSWRGMLHQVSDEAALREHLRGGRRLAYVGFDPTADSLTIGNLVPIMMLLHWARSGHTPVAVSGGGTGLIGDPSGKSTERQLLTEEVVRHNASRQRDIFERLFAHAGLHPPLLLNNADWLLPLGYIQVLRDVGKHFSVNQMVQRDSVRTRLESREQGISYTEFSYVILQAYDFLELHRAWDAHALPGPVTVQMGGSDQWGNIVSGADLIRRARLADGLRAEGAPPEAFALTAPLMTKADGTKFGKTESGAVWLTAPAPGDPAPARTSVYAYYQFWLNAADADVGRLLRTFTLLSRQEIASLEAEHAKDPGARSAQRALARAATSLLHGETQMRRAEQAAAALFSGAIAELSKATLDEVFAAVPTSSHDKAALGAGVRLLDLLALTSLARSKTEARQFLTDGSITINGRKAGPETTIGPDDLLHGSLLALRRGKKHWHLCRFG
jgi:tyrosyl-tRNA synthetase